LTDGLGERTSGLAQREVERGALERPAPVVAEGRHLGLRLEELESVQQLGEGVQRMRPGQGQLTRRRVVGGRVGDVLADALLAPAAQVHDRRHASEAARDVLLTPFE
jgi:hypothetical protein